jgi:hypothetical protein
MRRTWGITIGLILALVRGRPAAVTIALHFDAGTFDALAPEDFAALGVHFGLDCVYYSNNGPNGYRLALVVNNPGMLAAGPSPG